MSETVTRVDVKDATISALRTIEGMFVSDLKWIPADKLGASPMGSARSAADFAGEVAGFNTYVAAALLGKGNEVNMEGLPSTADLNCDQCSKCVSDSVQKLVDAISSISEEQFMQTVHAPWGSEMPGFELVRMAIWHMWYHDGQINYIQTLYGDTENHWMG